MKKYATIVFLFLCFSKSFSQEYYGSTNDPLFETQWNLDKTSFVNYWDVFKGDGVVIAILDVGFDLSHPDLVDNYYRDISGNIVGINTTTYGSPSDFDYQPLLYDPALYETHATKLAGVISMLPNNAIGGVGVLPNAKIMPIKIGYPHPQDPLVFSSLKQWQEGGIDFAIDNGANVICIASTWGGYNSDLEGKINEAVNVHGIPVVASIGNDGIGVAKYPAAYNNVIAVGASDQNDSYQSYSNYGNDLDLMAPSEIQTTDLEGNIGNSNDDYTNFGGTSAAVPQVCAIAGAIKYLNPSLTPNDIRTILRNSADKVGGSYDANGFNNYMGYGRLNAAAAFNETLTKYTGGVITSDVTFSNSTHLEGLNFINSSNITLTIPANTTTVIDNALITNATGSTKINVYGKLIVAEGTNLIKINLDIKDGGEFIIQPGSQLLLSGDSGEPWANIYVQPGAKFISYGTEDDPVKFRPYSGSTNKWHRIILKSSAGNFISWTLFDSAEEALYIRSQNNVIENSTFRNGWRGLSTHSNVDGSGNTFVKIRDILVEDNETVGIVAYNGDMEISGTTIQNNGQAGLYMYNSDIITFHHNLVQNNGQTSSTRDGIEVLSTSQLNMQNSNGGTVAPGFNKIINNADDQVSSSGYLVAGLIINNIGGYNTFDGYVNSSKQLIDNNSSYNPVMAFKNYWGGTPSSSDFEGSFTYCCNPGEYLTSDPTGSDTGSGNNVPLKTIGSQNQITSLEDLFNTQKEILFNSRNQSEIKNSIHTMHILSRSNSELNNSLSDNLSNALINIEVTGFAHLSREDERKSLRNFIKLQRLQLFINKNNYKAAEGISKSININYLNRSELIDYYSSLLAIHIYQENLNLAWETLNDLYNFEILNGRSLESIQANYSIIEENLISDMEQNGINLREMEFVKSEDQNSLSAYPNPFNPSTVISFALSTQSNVKLVVYDILGRQVAELIDNDLSIGVYKIQFDASNLSSGVYFYSININGKVSTNKFTLIK